MCVLLSACSFASVLADLRIVVDTSASMQQADPQNLRGTAVELLASAMPLDSVGGLWAYSELTQQLVSHGPTDELWRQLMAVHGRNLAPGNNQADPTTALQAATWDLQRADRGYRDVIWISNGLIETGATELENNNARQLILNTWASKLKANRVRVHTIGIQPDTAEESERVPLEQDFLRQVAQLSGGLFKTVQNREQMQAVVMDIVRFMQIRPTTSADRSGRFQITPDVSTLSLLWLHTPSAQAPTLETPDRQVLSRDTAVPDGRWLLARDFEMVTINQPQAGWWQIHGTAAHDIGIFGDVAIRVSGLDAPVIPTQESHATIQLFDAGELVQHQGFLDLLDVRAWIVDAKGRKPLPVEREADQFHAFFVSLQDGSFDLQVEVRAPTFTRQSTVPFVVTNPLRVDIKQANSGVNAWLTFNHAAVDYRTLKVSAKVRKPPAVGQIVPAQKLPAGLFQIPIAEQEGVVEMTFTVGGNYLNGEGFFVKTRRQTVTLPLLENQVMRFDAEGKRIDEPPPQEIIETRATAQPGGPDSATPRVVLNPELTQQNADTQPLEPQQPLIPLWFVGLISALNLLVAGGLWWINGPPKLDFELRLREVAEAA